MPYTERFAIVWVLLLILFASSASDIFTGPWILPVAAAACAKPLNLPLWPKPRYDAVPDQRGTPERF